MAIKTAKLDDAPKAAPAKSGTIHQRLLAAQVAAKRIGKSGHSAEDERGDSYKFVTHDDVTDEALRVLSEHGILFVPVLKTWAQSGNRTIVELAGHFYNADDPNDVLVVPSFGYGHDDEDKGPGKAMSYAKKYCLLQTLLLRAGEEADPERARVKHTARATPGDDFPGDRPFSADSAEGYAGDFGLGSIRLYTPGQFVAQCLTAVGQAQSPDDIDDVYRRNKASLDVLRDRAPDQFETIRSLAEGTRKKLAKLAADGGA